MWPSVIPSLEKLLQARPFARAKQDICNVLTFPHNIANFAVFRDFCQFCEFLIETNNLSGKL